MVAISSSEVLENEVKGNRRYGSLRWNFDDGEHRGRRSVYYPLATDLDQLVIDMGPEVLARYETSLKEDATSIPRDRIDEKFQELLELADNGTNVTNRQMQTLRDRLLQLAQHVRDNP